MCVRLLWHYRLGFCGSIMNRMSDLLWQVLDCYGYEEQHTLSESSGADHLTQRLYDAAGDGSSQSQGAHRHKLIV